MAAMEGGRSLLLEGRQVLPGPLEPIQAQPVQGQVVQVQAAPQALQGEPAPVVAVPAQLQMGTVIPMVPMPVASPSAQAHRILNQLQRVQIREQRQWVEALVNFEQNNRYVIRDEAGHEHFFIKEDSHWLERNFLQGACKPWRMDMYLLGPAGVRGGLESMTPFVHLERPCTLTCMWLNRPQVAITDLGSGAPLGSVLEPFTYCNLQFQLLDAAGQPILQAEAPCCQWGMLCRCPCQGTRCNSITFPVRDCGTGELIAQIEKYWMWGDFCQCLGEWDNYWVHFGAAANPEYKILLISLAIFIQMRFFDKRNRKK